MEVRHDYSSGMLRGDLRASQLRGLARKTKMRPAGAAASDAGGHLRWGNPHRGGEETGGVTLQIIRDWVMRFNARVLPALLDGKSPGQPSRLNDVQRQAIVRMVERSPIPAIHGVGALAADRSCAMDLRGVPHHGRQTDAEPGASRDGLPQALGTTPPSYAQAEGAIEDFKKLPSAPG